MSETVFFQICFDALNFNRFGLSAMIKLTSEIQKTKSWHAHFRFVSYLYREYVPEFLLVVISAIFIIRIALSHCNLNAKNKKTCSVIFFLAVNSF